MHDPHLSDGVVSFLDELKRRNVFRVGVAYAVVAWVIIQVVDVVAPRMALPEWVPGLIILLLVVGAPIALIFAWAYEITPEGLKKTEQVDVQASITRSTGRAIDRAIIVGLTVVVGLLLAERFLIGPAAAGNSRIAGVADASIAVLPFVNLSGDAGEDYFSDGISEELLNVLAQIPELRVAARTSSFQFKNDNQDVTQIARQLNVAHVLEGSVRRSGEEVRITAQLIDADDGFHLWSDTYTREMSDVFVVQDEISREIVTALREQLGLQLEATAVRSVATTNQAAWEAYLRGRHLVVQRTRASIEAAAGEFQSAIDLDPTYAPAYAELALATNFLEDGQYGSFTLSEVLERTEPLAARALELDPGLAEAHAAQGFVLWDQDDLDAALASFARALEINPNYAAVYNWTGNVLTDALGRYREGFESTGRALERDPLSIPALANTMIGLYDRGREDEAEALYTKLRTIAPGLALLGPAGAAAARGQLAESVELHLRALEIDPDAGRSLQAISGLLSQLGFPGDAARLDPEGEPYRRFSSGDFEQARTLFGELVREQPTDLRLRGFAAVADAASGDVSAASNLEMLWKEAGGHMSRNGTMTPMTAAALIRVRGTSGGDVPEVRTALADHQRRVHEAGVLLTSGFFGQFAVAEFLVGDRARALEAIAEAGAGWVLPRGIAFLADLEADPEYREILARRDRLVAAERAALLARICGVDHPGADVWTPSEQACSTRE